MIWMQWWIEMIADHHKMWDCFRNLLIHKQFDRLHSKWFNRNWRNCESIRETKNFHWQFVRIRSFFGSILKINSDPIDRNQKYDTNWFDFWRWIDRLKGERKLLSICFALASASSRKINRDQEWYNPWSDKHWLNLGRFIFFPDLKVSRLSN